MTRRRYSRGWTSFLILFSLPASDLSKRPPSDGQRGRQDRLFGLTGQAIYDLVPVRSNYSMQRVYHDGKGKTSLLFHRGNKNEHTSREKDVLEGVVPHPIFRMESGLRTSWMR